LDLTLILSTMNVMLFNLRRNVLRPSETTWMLSQLELLLLLPPALELVQLETTWMLLLPTVPSLEVLASDPTSTLLEEEAPLLDLHLQ